MKARAKLNRYLKSMGFGYFAPTYVRLHREGQHGESIQIDRQRPGLTIELGTFYICYRDVFPTIEPGELSGLWVDGRLSGISSTHQTAAFWDEKDVDSMIDAINSVGIDTLEYFSDPEFMIEVYDYLMSDPGGYDNCIQVFPTLGEKRINKGETPVRLLRRAAYLNLAGRFLEAIEAVQRYTLSTADFFYRKLLGDAEQQRIELPEESLDFLRSIDAAPR